MRHRILSLLVLAASACQAEEPVSCDEYRATMCAQMAECGWIDIATVPQCERDPSCICDATERRVELERCLDFFADVACPDEAVASACGVTCF